MRKKFSMSLSWAVDICLKEAGISEVLPSNPLLREVDNIEVDKTHFNMLGKRNMLGPFLEKNDNRIDQIQEWESKKQA